MFWLWLSALVGMVIKYCEVTLSVAYRTTNEKGELVGGPMYYITRGLGLKWLAVLFALFGFIASFGIGASVQANSLATGVNSSFGIPCGPSASWWLCWPPWWSSAASPASPA